MVMTDEFRQVQGNKLHDESYFVGVSGTHRQGEDKELVCKVHKRPSGSGLISLML